MKIEAEVSIVIVSHNCKQYVLECLDSIITKAGSINLEIIVIDNASEDGTVQAIRTLYPTVNLIENKKDLWFRPAVNQGIRKAQGRYILSLGPDTRLLTPGALSKMAEYLDTHPQVGILGVKLLNPDGKIQADCERFPGLGWVLCYYFFIHKLWPSNPVKRRWRYDGWDRQDTRVVDTVSGACMMLRREVFDMVGLLDESCLMYWEEADFCRAAHKAGWQVVHLADVEVLHYWRQGGVSTSPAKTLELLMEESMLHYYRKYYGTGVYRFLLLLFGFRRFLSRLFLIRCLRRMLQ